MIISEKLAKLRNSSGLSQEELAEKMNVSRQSVSKWESGASIPNLDKIVELSKIYGISTDYLLKDEIETLPEEIVPDVFEKTERREVSLETANEYLDAVRKGAKNIALGVLLCILSPAPLLFLLGLSVKNSAMIGEDLAAGIGTGGLLVIVAAAVVLFIVNGMKLSVYEYLEKEEIRLSYGVSGVVEKDEKSFQTIFQMYLSIGVALCIIAAVPLIVVGSMDISEGLELFMVALMLVIIALGVYLIVRVCIENGAYHKLLQKGDYTVENKEKNKRMGSFSSVYWGLMVAVYLGISFFTDAWDRTWIIWPVAGVMFAVVSTIVGDFRKNRKS